MSSRLQDELRQSKSFGSLRQEAVLQIARSSAVLVHAWEQYIRPYGITPTQYNVLRILRGAGDPGLSRHQVGLRLITQVPDVSRLLDRMMLAGLVIRTRGAEDRRTVNACITAKGLQILGELDGPSCAVPDTQLAGLTDDQVRTLIDLLEAVRGSAAERVPAPCSFPQGVRP